MVKIKSRDWFLIWIQYSLYHSCIKYILIFSDFSFLGYVVTAVHKFWFHLWLKTVGLWSWPNWFRELQLLLSFFFSYWLLMHQHYFPVPSGGAGFFFPGVVVGVGSGGSVWVSWGTNSRTVDILYLFIFCNHLKKIIFYISFNYIWRKILQLKIP